MSKYEELSESVIKGKIADVMALTQQHIDNGCQPLEIINDGLIAGMNVVGKRFKANEMFVPEVLMAAKSMSKGVELLKPLLTEGESGLKGKVVIGTVKGDLHDIGKNLVTLMLESNGYEVIDLGIDLPPEKFVDAIREHKPVVVGLSALLTTTMAAMKKTIDLITDEGLRENTKVIVGGAPVTEAFANEIGADGYASDAGTAVEIVETLANTLSATVG